MKRQRHTGKGFLKFIVSFLVILFFPVASITVVFNSYFVNLYQENILQQNQMNLEIYKTKIDSCIDNCTSVAVQILNIDGFSPNQLLGFHTSYEKIINILKAYQTAQDYYQEVRFYSFYNPDTVYSANGTINPAYFCRYGGKRMLLTELLKERTKSFWTIASSYTEGGEKKLIQYIVPVAGRNTDFILFDINEHIFEDISTENSIVNEIYYHGRLIYSSNPDPDIRLEKMQLLSEKSETTGMEYRRYIPTGVLLDKVKKVQRIFIYAVIAITIVGGILVYWVAVARYLPIKRLSALAKGAYPNLIPRSIGEFESIGFVIDRIKIGKEEDLLKSRISRLFYSIIYRQYEDLDVISEQCKQAGLFLEGKKWRAIILMLGGKQFVENADIAQICISILESDYEVYFLDYASQNYFTIILGRETDELPLLKNKLAAISGEINACFQREACLSVGGCYDTIDELAKSYNEAVLNSEREGPEGVSFYESQLKLEKRPAVYPKIELEVLRSSILGRDPERTSFFTNVLMRAVETNKYSNFEKISICHDIIHIYLDTAEELNIRENLLHEMRHTECCIQPSCTIGEYFYVIKGYEKTLLQAYSEDFRLDPLQESTELQGFIDAYPDISQLSVSFVAEHFGLSISNLSHRFKGQTGVNISNYIVAKRIEYSKRLLTETNMSLSEIAGKLSYCHTNSFMRVFKSVVGMTPGEYRRLFSTRMEGHR